VWELLEEKRILEITTSSVSEIFPGTKSLIISIPFGACLELNHFPNMWKIDFEISENDGEKVCRKPKKAN
jgi:hypothetical protein